MIPYARNCDIIIHERQMLVINMKLEIVIPHRIENIMKVRNNKDYLKGRHIHTLVCDKF